MKNKKDLKILLVQAREDEMADHEFDIIVENSGLAKENFVSFNVVHDKPFDLSKLDEYDGVIIGGAGSYSVLDDEPFIKFLEDIARYCKDKDIPFLGLCFGFQIAVQALGGKIIHDKENMEAGTYKMYRDEKSDDDPIVGSLPKEFLAGCGRKDRAEILPEGMVNYMWSDRCPYHYATFPGSRFFLVQFHPELWKKSDNLIRITHYREKYAMADDEFEAQVKMFCDAPESRFVISNFVENVIL